MGAVLNEHRVEGSRRIQPYTERRACWITKWYSQSSTIITLNHWNKFMCTESNAVASEHPFLYEKSPRKEHGREKPNYQLPNGWSAQFHAMTSCIETVWSLSRSVYHDSPRRGTSSYKWSYPKGREANVHRSLLSTQLHFRLIARTIKIYFGILLSMRESSTMQEQASSF